MADNENTTVEINVDLDGIESKLKTIDVGLVGLKSKVIEMQATISGGVSSMQAALEEVNKGILTEGQTIESIIRDLIGTVSLGLTGIVQEVTKVLEALIGLKQDQAISGVKDDGFQMADLTFKLMELVQQYKGSNNKPTTGAGPLLLGPGSNTPGGDKSSTPSSDTSGINGIISASFGDPMSFSAAMGDLMESIGGVTAKLKESVIAWGEQTAAKIASKAEDAAIIALYAVDYVKQFGAMIAKLAASTAAWVANTAPTLKRRCPPSRKPWR